MEKNSLDTSKVVTGLDPLSQMRSKNNSGPSKPPKKKPDFEPRILDFDKMNKKPQENETKKLFKDSSPLQPEEIKEKDDNKNFIIKGSNSTFKDMKSLGFTNDERLLGEVILEISEASIILNSSMFDGKLVLTNFKLHFRPNRNEFYQSYQVRPDYFQMPIMFIDKFGKYPEKKTNVLYIDLVTKDLRIFKFRVPSESFKDGEKVFFMLENFLTKKKKEHTAIDYAQNYKQIDQEFKGWKIYDIVNEFNRENADICTDNNMNNNDFSLRCYDNSNGQTCNTYPETLIVPSKASDDLIIKSSKFRTKERVPALTYCYRQLINGQVTRTYLWRSSQCKSGLGSVQRSLEDEDLLKIIGETSDFSNINNNNNNNSLNFQNKMNGTLKIFDARPFWNAVGNAVTGKGYENKDNYKNTDVVFLDIHNIHKVRDSYKKLMTACMSQENVSKWFSSLENSGWFHHISTILSGTLQVAESLKKGYHTLVHCSDGWDRTSQVLSLAQILLDPYFRTVEGFMVLIEKDWLSFGHQFALRSGHSDTVNETQKSPIFIQFLDCVHQIMHQFPMSFEFNIKLLNEMAYHLYSCYFGTFLFDSPNERSKYNLQEKTISIWSFLLSTKERFLNPFYRESQQIDMNELWPNSSLKALRLWKEHFFAYNLETKDPYQIFPDANFLEDNMLIEHFRSQEERKLLKMRVSDLNQDVIKLKKILHKYEEKFGKLKKQSKGASLNNSNDIALENKDNKNASNQPEDKINSNINENN